MKPSRFLLTLGLLGIAYAPAVSAKFIEDIIPSTNYTTPSPAAIPPAATGGSITTTAPVAPTGTLTRAEFTQMIVSRLYPQAEIDRCYWDIASTLPPTFTLLYTDVPASSPYGKALCIAMRDGLARGYKDGSFRPNDVIRFSEASKIISRAYVLAPYAESTTTGAWFSQYAFALANRNAVPMTVTTFQHAMTAAETEEILKRLAGSITWEPARTYTEIEQASRPRAASMTTVSSTTESRTPIKTTSDASVKPNTSSSSSSAKKEENGSESPWYKLF